MDPQPLSPFKELAESAARGYRIRGIAITKAFVHVYEATRALKTITDRTAVPRFVTNDELEEIRKDLEQALEYLRDDEETI